MPDGDAIGFYIGNDSEVGTRAIVQLLRSLRILQEKNLIAVRTLHPQSTSSPQRSRLKPARHPYHLHPVPDNRSLYVALALLAVSSSIFSQAAGYTVESMDSEHRALLRHQYRQQFRFRLQYISARSYHPP